MHIVLIQFHGYLSVGKDYHMNEHNQKHLTLSNRTYIEQELLQKSTFISYHTNATRLANLHMFVITVRTTNLALTGHGSEFKNPWDIEKTESGIHRTYVFYCDPYVSNQKGRLEKNHEYIRYVIPKGHSMYRYTQDDTLILWPATSTLL